jgi:uncharacterized protein with GYD domain
MAKFLFAATYTKQGIDGVRASGAQARLDAIGALVGSVGGVVEAFYFVFGDADAYVVVDLPDDEAAAAVALAVVGSGAASTRTTKLLTAAQVDAAMAKGISYRPPGT